MLLQASYFIKTRMYYSGFPNRFQYYPETMGAGDLEMIHPLALDVMTDPRGIDTPDRLRRCVIAQGGFLILGIGGFISDILKEEAEEYNKFCDKSNTRKVYGFFAFVFALRRGKALPKSFPAVEEYARLIRETILPYWKDSDNSRKSVSFSRGIPVPFDFPVECVQPDPSNVALLDFNYSKENIALIRTESIDNVLNAALLKVGKGADISACAGENIGNTPTTTFRNWIMPGSVNTIRIVDTQGLGKEASNYYEPQKQSGQDPMNSEPLNRPRRSSNNDDTVFSGVLDMLQTVSENDGSGNFSEGKRPASSSQDYSHDTREYLVSMCFEIDEILYRDDEAKLLKSLLGNFEWVNKVDVTDSRNGKIINLLIEGYENIRYTINRIKNDIISKQQKQGVFCWINTQTIKWRYSPVDDYGGRNERRNGLSKMIQWIFSVDSANNENNNDTRGIKKREIETPDDIRKKKRGLKPLENDAAPCPKPARKNGKTDPFNL